MEMNTTTRWSPGDYLSGQSETIPSFALIILNQPIVDAATFTRLWKNAKLRVCADGGANHLHSFRIDDDIPIPNCITGDLDSLRPDVEDYYRTRGVLVIKNPSQYSTDFGKSLSWIYKQVGEDESTVAAAAAITANSNRYDGDAENTPHDDARRVIDVVAYGATGGRVDQTFHSFHQLFEARQRPRGEGQGPQKVTLVSEENVTFLLEKGRNVIATPLGMFGKTCGIIPLNGPAIITTKGLEWDLEDTETKFGGMVSTSNHLVKEEVEITTTDVILFTMEIRRNP